MSDAAFEIAVRFERSGLSRGRAALGRATRELLAALLRDARFRGGSVSALFCSEVAIRHLKRGFFGEDRTTDVLSFPAEDRFPNPRRDRAPYFGDLALCLPFCARQAAERGVPLAEETALLLVHGMLHLLGYDHDTPDRKRAMWAEQRRLLRLPEARALAALPLAINP